MKITKKGTNSFCPRIFYSMDKSIWTAYTLSHNKAMKREHKYTGQKTGIQLMEVEI